MNDKKGPLSKTRGAPFVFSSLAVLRPRNQGHSGLVKLFASRYGQGLRVMLIPEP